MEPRSSSYPLTGLPKMAFEMASGLMLIMPVLMSLLALIILFLPSPQLKDKLLLLALVLPLVVVSLIAYRLFSKGLAESRLELSPEGIKQVQFGITQFAPWEDVLSITKVSQGRVMVEGLKLREVKLSGQPWAVWLTTLGGKHLEIPLASYARNWRDSALADDLESYAPWLFENDQQ